METSTPDSMVEYDSITGFAMCMEIPECPEIVEESYPGVPSDWVPMIY